MANDTPSAPTAPRNDRSPPNSEEAEKGVLGSILLDYQRVLDLCIEKQLVPDSFYVPAHRAIYESLHEMFRDNQVVDALTLGEKLKAAGKLERVGGSGFIERLIDATPTAAHAEYYIEIVRQKHLLRAIISAARKTENECFTSQESADQILGRAEQEFLGIAESRHGEMLDWTTSVNKTMTYLETVFNDHGKALNGVPTGFQNMDRLLHGLRVGEMIVVAARPSMGKTSLAMNIAENVALGRGPDRTPRAVGIFSLEMSQESLVLRMLCSHAGVNSFELMRGYPKREDHVKLTQAASVLRKAPIYLDDQGGLDIVELRARARRMKQRYSISLVVVDYLQLLHSREGGRDGRQQEVADISGQLKAMSKELHVPVLVLSQLNRAPERTEGRPKLSDLRDSGAIEQDADVVCLLRRPCKIQGDDRAGDLSLAIVDIAKHRNGPTGEVELNFEEEYTRFRDRAVGVDEMANAQAAPPPREEPAAPPPDLLPPA